MSAKSKKGKNKTEDCTGMITRSLGIHSIETGENLEQGNSNDMENEQDSSVDIVNQNVGNNSITNASSSQTSSTGYPGYQHASSAVIHTVINRPVFDGKIDHFPSWDMQLEAHLHERNMTTLLKQNNPDPIQNECLFYELVRCLGFKNAHVIDGFKPDGKKAYFGIKKHFLGDQLAQKTVAIQEFHNLKMPQNATMQNFLLSTDIMVKK